MALSGVGGERVELRGRMCGGFTMCGSVSRLASEERLDLPISGTALAAEIVLSLLCRGFVAGGEEASSSSLERCCRCSTAVGAVAVSAESAGVSGRAERVGTCRHGQLGGRVDTAASPGASDDGGDGRAVADVRTADVFRNLRNLLAILVVTEPSGITTGVSDDRLDTDISCKYSQ
jgi:hypothetical protein